MIVLGIETSCDETACALLESDGRVLADIVHSQIPVHAEFGGVVPELASRAHADTIHPAVQQALARAHASPRDVGAVAVTVGPGLAGSLLMGVAYANALACAWGVPLFPVNHLQAHAQAAAFGDPAVRFPHLMLLVSGGHTLLALVRAPGALELLGRTVDDAAGEAFDKVSKLLGWGYPGGPVIDRRAKLGNAAAIAFPRGMSGREGLDFSFSGLKTAVLYYVRGIGKLRRPEGPLEEEEKNHIAASFQEAVVDILWKKAARALKTTGLKQLCLSGGVACNSRLREKFHRNAAQAGIDCRIPPPKLCTDNAVMIAALAHAQMAAGARGLCGYDLEALPNMPADRNGLAPS